MARFALGLAGAQNPMQPSTAKLKNIRNKYRQAVNTGRGSGQGRVGDLGWVACYALHRRRCCAEIGDLEKSVTRGRCSVNFRLRTRLVHIVVTVPGSLCCGEDALIEHARRFNREKNVIRHILCFH